MPEAHSGIENYFQFYNYERLHQSLAYQTPAAVYEAEPKKRNEPRRQRVLILFWKNGEPKPKDLGARLTYRSKKMFLTMGSTLEVELLRDINC